MFVFLNQILINKTQQGRVTSPAAEYGKGSDGGKLQGFGSIAQRGLWGILVEIGTLTTDQKYEKP